MISKDIVKIGQIWESVDQTRKIIVTNIKGTSISAREIGVQSNQYIIYYPTFARIKPSGQPEAYWAHNWKLVGETFICPHECCKNDV